VCLYRTCSGLKRICEVITSLVSGGGAGGGGDGISY
jgi:hypothetical protein